MDVASQQCLGNSWPRARTPLCGVPLAELFLRTSFRGRPFHSPFLGPPSADTIFGTAMRRHMRTIASTFKAQNGRRIAVRSTNGNLQVSGDVSCSEAMEAVVKAATGTPAEPKPSPEDVANVVAAPALPVLPALPALPALPSVSDLSALPALPEYADFPYARVNPTGSACAVRAAGRTAQGHSGREACNNDKYM